jgi:hypothetical protein
MFPIRRSVEREHCNALSGSFEPVVLDAASRGARRVIKTVDSRPHSVPVAANRCGARETPGGSGEDVDEPE